MEAKMTFGKFVMRKRKEMGFTQKQLAEKLFITESAVSKWERGVSYPDISLVASICEVLEISEHELITASEDYHQRQIENDAMKFHRLLKTYAWIFYILYGGSLLICFICNLAVEHKLSWFFIVLMGELVAFSITSLPVILQKHRFINSSFVCLVSILLLLLTCCIYTGGDWFVMAFISLVFSYVVVFLPLIIREIPLPKLLQNQKALLCFVIDTALLFLLVIEGCLYSGDAEGVVKGVLVTLVCLVLPWLLMIIIRYVRINVLFRAGICLALSGAYAFFINSVLSVIIDGEKFAMTRINFTVWNETYTGGNVNCIIMLALEAMAVLFIIGGISLMIKKEELKEL